MKKPAEFRLIGKDVLRVELPGDIRDAVEHLREPGEVVRLEGRIGVRSDPAVTAERVEDIDRAGAGHPLQRGEPGDVRQ